MSDRFWLDQTLTMVVSCLVLCGCSQAFDDANSPHASGPQNASGGDPHQATAALNPAQNPPLTEEANDDPGADRSGQADQYLQRRKAMVARQLAGRDIRNQRVLQAMQRVPRHAFVPKGEMSRAYFDSPLPIGHGQTISQPYIVALMTQLVDPKPTDKALDIGTGSGYQAAVLAETVDTVYSIEIVEPLAAEAKTRLASLGYKNVHTRQGDGYRGWPEQAPFDIIIVAAAPDHIPQPLIDQLAPDGTMVIPVGDAWQYLIRIDKDEKGVVKKARVAPVAFVPMTGEARD